GLGKAGQVELKDQRQADQERPLMPCRSHDLLTLGVEVEDEHAIAEAAQCRRQVPQAEILLVLVADQHDRARHVARPPARRREIFADQAVEGGHRALPRTAAQPPRAWPIARCTPDHSSTRAPDGAGLTGRRPFSTACRTGWLPYSRINANAGSGGLGL